MNAVEPKTPRFTSILVGGLPSTNDEVSAVRTRDNESITIGKMSAVLESWADMAEKMKTMSKPSPSPDTSALEAHVASLAKENNELRSELDKAADALAGSSGVGSKELENERAKNRDAQAEMQRIREQVADLEKLRHASKLAEIRAKEQLDDKMEIVGTLSGEIEELNQKLSVRPPVVYGDAEAMQGWKARVRNIELCLARSFPTMFDFDEE
jgi:DNA repair exonuclease SbcCD ATPase subunit